jgi:hypothetical protein
VSYVERVSHSLTLLLQFADQLYPDTEAEGAEKSDEDDEEQDIEAAIAKEVNTMSKKPKSEKRFANITTDTDCGTYCLYSTSLSTGYK